MCERAEWRMHRDRKWVRGCRGEDGDLRFFTGWWNLIVVLVAQLCKYTDNHWIILFKQVNSVVCRLYPNNAVSKEKAQGPNQTSGAACGLWVSSPELVSSLYFQNLAILNMYECFDFLIHLSVLRCLKIISSAGNKKLCVLCVATPAVSSTWCPQVAWGGGDHGVTH